MSVPAQFPLRRVSLFLSLLALPLTGLRAENEPILVEAESGTLGGDFQTASADGITYITPETDLSTSPNSYCPGVAAKVATYTVAFPVAGTYNLYVRLRVGSGGADDDSFFYGNGFGVKDAAAQADWILVNGIAGVGFVDLAETVTAEGSTWGGGAATTEVWKWLRLSSSTYGAAGVQFVVDAAGTRIFQLASRENGLDIDCVAFGLDGVYYTVAQLEDGEAGTTTEPVASYTPPGPPLATGKAKFLGCAYSSDSVTNFEKYFNQVVPGNAGKWGTVEATRGTYDWTELDAAYRLAKANGFKFRYHVLVWGSQQPAWIDSLTTAEKLQAIKDWFAAVAAHTVDGEVIDPDWIEVVNEPLHAPPNGETIAFSTTTAANYTDALGGTGTTGWDWVLNAFRLAREYFPGKKLMLNEYGITGSADTAASYVEIIRLLQAESLVDLVGFQGHSFETKEFDTATISANLETLAATGLPIIVTEMDLADTADAPQLDDYQRIFPLFWEHPSVIGVTLWGYRPGLWVSTANIVLSNGVEKPAMLWLKEYVGDNLPVVTADQSFLVGDNATDGTLLGVVQATDADAGAVLQDWSITGGTAAAACAIDASTGALTLTDAAALDFGTSATYSLFVKVGDGIGHSVATTVLLAAEPVPVISTQPVDCTASVGATATFSAAATSSDAGLAITYRWQYSADGETFGDLDGATSSTLSLPSVALSATGHYRVVATNSAGTVTSDSARLDVVPATIAALQTDGYGTAATGGTGTGSVAVSAATSADFIAAATAATPRVITVIGTLDVGTVVLTSDKTIQGADADAAIVGLLQVGSGVSNVVVRGLTLSNPAGDALSISGASEVFVTRCTFLDASDHQLRIAAGADLVTVSWCEFAASSATADHRYSVIVGETGTETKALRVTLHHNWWTANIDQRMPLANYGQVHCYNNLLEAENNTSATVADNRTELLNERNVYSGVHDPLLKQASSDSLAAAEIQVLDDIYTSCTGTDPDAGTDTVFTPAYSYRMDAAADAAVVVPADAGNLAGVGYTESTPGSVSISGPAAAVSPGATLSLSATLSGVTASAYQWRLGNKPISGATSATYSATMASAYAGTYSVVVTQAAGDAVVSSPFVVTLGTATDSGGSSSGGSTGGSSSGGGGGALPWWLAGLGGALLAWRARRRS